MYNRKDLSALFLFDPTDKGVSYKHVYNLCVPMVRDGRMASDALHIVYKRITGRSHLAFTDHNSAGYPTYRDKPDYALLAQALLPRLRKLVRAKKYQEGTDRYFLQAVDPELCRGVDLDQLRDIGILMANRANISV